ncbi:DUF1002 domain-containing protein [Shouchella clausii]|uniref:DUF1002 domain-containing protein n=1 Tax=Shouchella clausii TaxID=79880 RepID=UPI003983A83A
MRTKLKKISIALTALLLVISFMPKLAFADAVPGDVIVTLGQNLSEEQKRDILKRMELPDEYETIYVTNEEEHLYLGQYISGSQIGNKALSSSKITIAPAGTGIQVTSDRISWVSNEMYANALVTAGVQDAEVYVTAPFEVSGTAALTGLIKAYETAADLDIPEEQKTVANEEMIRTAELAESIGSEEANELITRVKEEIASTSIETEEEMRTIIIKLADEINVTLSDQETDELTALFMKMKDLDIDWDHLKDQLSKVRENFGNFVESEEAKSFLDSFIDAMKRFFDSIADLFRS